MPAPAENITPAAEKVDPVAKTEQPTADIIRLDEHRSENVNDNAPQPVENISVPPQSSAETAIVPLPTADVITDTTDKFTQQALDIFTGFKGFRGKEAGGTGLVQIRGRFSQNARLGSLIDIEGDKYTHLGTKIMSGWERTVKQYGEQAQTEYARIAGRTQAAETLLTNLEAHKASLQTATAKEVASDQRLAQFKAARRSTGKGLGRWLNPIRIAKATGYRALDSAEYIAGGATDAVGAIKRGAANAYKHVSGNSDISGKVIDNAIAATKSVKAAAEAKQKKWDTKMQESITDDRKIWNGVQTDLAVSEDAKVREQQLAQYFTANKAQIRQYQAEALSGSYRRTTNKLLGQLRSGDSNQILQAGYYFGIYSGSPESIKTTVEKLVKLRTTSIFTAVDQQITDGKIDQARAKIIFGALGNLSGALKTTTVVNDAVERNRIAKSEAILKRQRIETFAQLLQPVDSRDQSFDWSKSVIDSNSARNFTVDPPHKCDLMIKIHNTVRPLTDYRIATINQQTGQIILSKTENNKTTKITLSTTQNLGISIEVTGEIPISAKLTDLQKISNVGSFQTTT